MRALEIAHAEDPATKLAREIGDVTWFTLFGPTVLVAQYIPGGLDKEVRTKGNIIIPQDALNEFSWQGKIGLCLNVGPLAFEDSDDGRYKFKGAKVKIGDWCVYRSSDGLQMMLDKHLCRILQDVHVLGVIPQPDRVY